MKQDTLISIYTKGSNGHLDENGVWIQDDSIIVSSYAFIEPYSRQLAVFKYGIDVEANKRIFIDHVINGIKVGMTVKFKNEFGIDEECEIKAIPWYKKHMEIIGYSKESVENGG